MEPPPPNCTFGTVHVAAAGTPAQAKEAVPVKPLPCVSCAASPMRSRVRPRRHAASRPLRVLKAQWCNAKPQFKPQFKPRFRRQRSRRAMICLFLALLELVKLQALGLTQPDAFGEIGLKRLKGFEAAFSTETNLAAIEEGYQ